MNKQDEKLIKTYMFETKNIHETDIELFWLIPPLIFSRQIFRKRKDLENFVSNIMKLEYSNYVFKSRSILVGRIQKNILSMDLEESVTLRNNVVDFLKSWIESEYIESIDSKGKEKTTDNFFSDWAAIIQKKNNN